MVELEMSMGHMHTFFPQSFGWVMIAICTFELGFGAPVVSGSGLGSWACGFINYYHG